ncbi:MAG: PaaI family thioesterase [Promethearchaeota archaeon]
MQKKNPLQTKGFHPFGDLIGLNFTKFGTGYSQCVIEVNENLMNPHKGVHGGVIYTMADTGMGGALYFHLNSGELCATVEIKIVYFSVVKSGKLICDTNIIHKSKRIAILESVITNNGRLIAKALGTYSIFKVKKI